MPNLRFFILVAISFWSSLSCFAYAEVRLGSDQIADHQYASILKGKRIGLITNHTAVNSRMESTIDIFKAKAKAGNFTLAALFAPEHGLTGSEHAGNPVVDSEEDGIPVYSLHGKTRRPTDDMLKQIDVLVYDIQDIGCRSYTYISTLFYAMEECAKKNIPLVVLDRPNPINGLTVDGPVMDNQYRSFLGYASVPYCHGMTVGELSRFFNAEYGVGCQLTVVPMKGWSRKMTFYDTGLPWIPTSPYIPEATTVYYYPTTGILGEFSFVNIGIGFTLPFKLVGAPWIDGKKFARALNAQKFPGVHFEPFHYCPFYGKFAKENCQGVLIMITDPAAYRPFATFYLLVGILKSLYPKKFNDILQTLKNRQDNFIRLVGSKAAYQIITQEKNIVWKLRTLHDKQLSDFEDVRKKYLITDYED